MDEDESDADFLRRWDKANAALTVAFILMGVGGLIFLGLLIF